MSILVSNFHVRTDHGVLPEWQKCLPGPAWIAPPTQGWTSVYLALEDRLDETAQFCSRLLHTATLSITVHDSDRFGWKLFEKGQLAHHGSVAPISVGPSEVEDVVRLLPYCRPGTTADELQRILQPATAAARSSGSEAAERARRMLDASLSVFRSLPPEVVDQLLERVKQETGPDHPMWQAMGTDKTAVLRQVADASAALRASSDALAHQTGTAMEPSMRLLGEATTIPVPLDNLARLLGLEQRIPLTYTLLDDPEEEGWRQVVGSAG